MKEDQVIEKLIKEKVLDDKSIYVYASVKGGIGGVIGTINGLVLLSVYKDVLYIQKANIDNSYGEQLAKIHIPDMKNIRGKAGLFTEVSNEKIKQGLDGNNPEVFASVLTESVQKSLEKNSYGKAVTVKVSVEKDTSGKYGLFLFFILPTNLAVQFTILSGCYTSVSLKDRNKITLR